MSHAVALSWPVLAIHMLSVHTVLSHVSDCPPLEVRTYVSKALETCAAGTSGALVFL